MLVTRDANGVLRAFVNVCRHRGAVLTEGCGSRATIQCHYHAWTYALDGSLSAAPRSEREPDFDKADWSLLPASVGTWGPFLFVNPDPEAVSLEAHLADLPEILARDIDIDALVFHSRVEFGANANWKVVVENFLECYHCPTAHPAFSDEVDVHPDRYLLEAHPTFCAQFCRTKAGGEQGQFHLLFPNTGLNVFPGPPNLSIGPIAPNGPNRTERYLDYFFAPDVDASWREEFFAFDDQIGREDTALVESVHRGMASGMLAQGRSAAGLGAAPRGVPELAVRAALELHEQRPAGKLDAAAELFDHEARDRGAEISERLTGHDGRCICGERRELELASAHLPGHAIDGAVPKRCRRKRSQRATDRNHLGRDRRAFAPDGDPLVVRPRELERVDLAKRRLPAAVLDPRCSTELVEQPRQLLGRLLDHLEEPGRALVLIAHAIQGSREAVDRRERRAQVMAGQRDDLGKAAVVHRALRFYPMAGIRTDLTLDLQASLPEVQLGLTRAGVTGVQKAIRIRHEGHEKTFAATISCTVDLDPHQKGVHMSRFPELFGEAIDEVVIGEAFLVETLAEHIASHIVSRQHAPGRGADPGAVPARAAHTGDRPADPGHRDAGRDRRRLARARPPRRRRRGLGDQRLPVRAGPRARRRARERLERGLRLTATSTASSISCRSRPTTSGARARC